MPAFAPIVTNDMAVSIHTYGRGVPLYQFPPERITSLRWNRALRDTSQCDLQVPSLLDGWHLPNISPWLHWLSVWEPRGTEPVWTGPIRSVSSDDNTTSINARDVSALLARTRTPMTLRWDATDPAYIAGELWERMIRHHGLRARPVVRPDPDGKRYDHQVKADSAMLAADMEQLVQMGLRWTVVGGVPILGPAPRTPVASLGREHFTNNGPTITRDGSQMFNDVLVRAPDNVAHAIAPMGGLNLQTIANRDSMFGQGNVERQALELAKYSAAARDILTLPQGATLDPSAPITLAMLIPSHRLRIEAYGLLTLQEITGVEVSIAPGAADAKITTASVNDNEPDLIDSTKGSV